MLEAFFDGTLPRDLLICGAAGTGKTYGILTFLHCLARDNDNLRILLCRATRAALTESVLVTYEKRVLPLDGMEYLAAGCQRKQRHSYAYPSGSEMVCGSLDNPDRILSTEWDFVFINEAIEATEEVWETLFSRMGRPGRESEYGYLIGDTNPGIPSHWLKQRCDRGKTTLWDTRHQANPAMYEWDEGEDAWRWTPEGEQYLDNLRQLTGSRRKRLLEGLWAVGEGLWFDSFDTDRHEKHEAEYDPALPVYLAVDPGVWTGAVLFQVREIGTDKFANVFGDYLSYGLSAERNANALITLIEERTRAKPPVDGEDAPLGWPTQCYSDPAGGAKNPIGPTVFQEYGKAKLPLVAWSAANPSVSASLDNVEQMLNPIGGVPRLTIHLRCRHLIDAFSSYQRAKVKDQYVDWPVDPQHPAEELIDALRGGLHARTRRNLVMTITQHPDEPPGGQWDDDDD